MKQENVIVLIKEIADQLNSIYNHEVEREQVAWWMLQAITKKSEVILIAQKIIILQDQEQKKLAEWIYEHTVNKKPLQYILGSVPFCDLSILVEPPILIPRPETEEWCTRLIHQLKNVSQQELSILDLCTGSGCIALALAHALPQAKIVATDIADHALALAQKNAKHNNIFNVKFIKSDLYDHISPDMKFDMIVANPPYISPAMFDQLSLMVKNWEDRVALIADDQGLAVIFAVIEQAKKFLKPNELFKKYNIPQLVIEIDYWQGERVAAFMKQCGFRDIHIKQDLEGKDRVALGAF